MSAYHRPTRRHASYAILAIAFASAGLCLAAPAPLPRDERRTVPFVPPSNLDDLATLSEVGGDVRRGAAVLKPKFEEFYKVEEKAYFPRRQGGVGVGPKANFDGINRKIQCLAVLHLTAEQLKAEQPALTRMAHHVLAATAVARLYGPE